MTNKRKIQKTIAALTTVCAVSLTACSTNEPAETSQEDEQAAPLDAAELLSLIQDDISGATDCDTEQTVDYGGAGEAMCGLPESELAVGSTTNALTVTVFANVDHYAEYEATWGPFDNPQYISTEEMWTVTAPNQNLADEIGALLDERH